MNRKQVSINKEKAKSNRNLLRSLIAGYSLFIIHCSLLIVLLSSCPGDKEPDYTKITLNLSAAVPQADAELAIAADYAGMCHAGYSSNLEREYAMLNEMGVVWLHRDFSWNRIQRYGADDWGYEREGFDSYVQRANAAGKKVMGMLLYGVDWVHDVPGGCGEDRDDRIICNAAEIEYFREYAVQTVKRYNGKPGSAGTVDAWLIWNEPDLQPRFWTGTQEQFFALNKAVAEAIRALDAEEGTETTLIGGVFTAQVSTSWINGLFEHGGMLENNVDISFHPYTTLPLGSMYSFNEFKQKVVAQGFQGKFWVNEMGYPTYSKKGSLPPNSYGTDQYEGDMPEIVAKTFTLLATAGVHSLTWYHLFDGPNREANSEHWFGLVWQKSDSEWIRKGGYWGYAVCAKTIPGKTYIQLDFPASVPSYIKPYYFEGTDGSRTLIVWNTDPLETVDLHVTVGGRNHKLWNLNTGKSSAIGKTSRHTLYPINEYKKTMIVITWED